MRGGRKSERASCFAKERETERVRVSELQGRILQCDIKNETAVGKNPPADRCELIGMFSSSIEAAQLKSSSFSF